MAADPRQFTVEQRRAIVAEFEAIPANKRGARKAWLKAHRYDSSMMSRWRHRPDMRGAAPRLLATSKHAKRYPYDREQWKKIVGEVDAAIGTASKAAVCGKWEVTRDIVSYYKWKFKHSVRKGGTGTGEKEKLVADWLASGDTATAVASRFRRSPDFALRAIADAGYDVRSRERKADLVETTNKALMKISEHGGSGPSALINRKAISSLTKRYLLSLEEAGVTLRSLTNDNGEVSVRYEHTETFTI